MSSPEPTNESLVLEVAAHEAGERLDAFLAARLTRYSRSHLRRAISTSGVTVDGKRTKVAYRLLAGQRVEVVLPQLPREGPEPENIPLDVLYEDEHLIAINKPAGMVVHPAKGHWSGTLASALAYRFGKLSTAGGPTRPGIIHRLDRETSGVLVVAKTNEAHAAVASQFESRRTEKEYFAIVQGVPDRDSDVICRAVGMHPSQREKMAIRAEHSTSRDATTRYTVIERFARFAALAVMPRTGRTHQIRVHLAHIGCPILCDRLYAGRSTITRGQIRGQGEDELVLLDRMALHAKRLKITHPDSGRPIEFIAPLPDDLVRVLAELRSVRAK
jgi:23S rRNA pseudouridine1911/1915/1917 synthase